MRTIMRTMRRQKNKMKKIILIFTMILAGVSLAFANDSVITEGSESVAVNYDEHDISIEDEKLDIYPHKDFYRVTVRYEYFNGGAEKKIRLGFPVKYVSSAGKDEKNSMISNFKFSQVFNGEKINLKEEYDSVEKDKPYDLSGTYWFVREVTFRHGKNISEIEYEAPYSRGGWYHRFDYIINTAACWNNKIKSLEIKIHNDNEVLISSRGWRVGTYDCDTCSKNLKVSDNVFSFTFTNADPKKLNEVYFRLEPNSYSSDRSILFDDPASGWCYNMYKVYNDKDEIWLYTKEQIQLFINYFYAIRGYPFKNQKLREYFDGMGFDVLNEACRYTPDENFTEQKFNDVEKANIEFLRKLKNKL